MIEKNQPNERRSITIGVGLEDGPSKTTTYSEFDVFGKVGGVWPVAKSHENTIAITSAVSKLCEAIKRHPISLAVVGGVSIRPREWGGGWVSGIAITSAESFLKPIIFHIGESENSKIVDFLKGTPTMFLKICVVVLDMFCWQLC